MSDKENCERSFNRLLGRQALKGYILISTNEHEVIDLKASLNEFRDKNLEIFNEWEFIIEEEKDVLDGINSIIQNQPFNQYKLKMLELDRIERDRVELMERMSKKRKQELKESKWIPKKKNEPILVHTRSDGKTTVIHPKGVIGVQNSDVIVNHF